MTDGPTDRATGGSAGTVTATGPILDPRTSAELDARWSDIQPRFVDDPHRSVADADELVTDAIDAIRASLEADRRRLEERWSAGDEPSTEDLRRLLQRYRALFSRLLEV